MRTPPVAKEIGKQPVHDGRADLALYVVADERQAALGKFALPRLVRGDENGNAVDEAAAGGKRLLRIPARGDFGTDRKIGDEHVRPGLPQDLRNVSGGSIGLLDLLAQIAADAVERPAALDDYAGGGNIRKAERVIGSGVDGFGDIAPDLRSGDVEGRGDLDIADVISAEIGMHQPRNRLVLLRVAIECQPLDEGGRAIADTDQPDPNGVRSHLTTTPAQYLQCLPNPRATDWFLLLSPVSRASRIEFSRSALKGRTGK